MHKTDAEFQPLDVRGTSVRLMRAGSGAPLVFLRGTDASDGWRDYMSLLARDFDVIVPEHPGFGGRAKPEWLESIGDLANFYLDFLAALDLHGVHLAGCDLGGWIAAELAIRDPRRVASLALCSAVGLHVEGVATPDYFLSSEEEMLQASFVDRAIAAAEIARRLGPESEDMRLANAVVVAQVAWTPRWHNPDLRKWAHRIDVPAAVIWGTQDRVLPLAHGKAWHSLIHGAKLVMIEGAGHCPEIEKPEHFVQALAEFAHGVKSPRAIQDEGKFA